MKLWRKIMLGVVICFCLTNSSPGQQANSSPQDGLPTFHPNQKWLFFIRNKTDLCRADVNRKNEKLLFKSKLIVYHGTPPIPPQGYITNIQLSPNGTKVYFEVANENIANELHVMSPDGSNHKILGQGNATKIILSTDDKSAQKYSGYIVTRQSKHWLVGGVYNWYWLYSPNWQEIGPLGELPNDFNWAWGIHYTDKSEPSYIIINNKVDPAFVIFWQEFQAAIKAGDKEKVAQMTRFPLEGDRPLTKEAFIKQYDEIFDSEAKKIIVATPANQIKEYNESNEPLQYHLTVEYECEDCGSQQFFHFSQDKNNRYKLMAIFGAG